MLNKMSCSQIKGKIKIGFFAVRTHRGSVSERGKKEFPYLDHRSVSRINACGFDGQNLVQGLHVVVEILEDGGSFPQNAVSAEEHVVLL